MATKDSPAWAAEKARAEQEERAGRVERSRRYWAVVDELPLMGLSHRELRLYRAVLDEQFRSGLSFWRCTQKEDLCRLTRIDKQNLSLPMESLKARAMFDWEQEEESGHWLFTAVMDPGFWIGRAGEIDRKGYYQGLAALRGLNACAQPSPPLPGLEPERGLTDALREVLNGAHAGRSVPAGGGEENFVPARPPAGGSPRADYHQDRGSDADVRSLQGDSSEPGRVNAINGHNAQNAQYGEGAVSLDGGAAPCSESNQGTKGGSRIPSLIARMRAAAAGESIGHEGEQSGQAGESSHQPAVLKSSTGQAPEAAPEVPGMVPGRGRVLKLSTDRLPERPVPGGEFSNRVPKVLNLSTGPGSGPVSEVPINDIIEQCSNACTKHYSMLTLFVRRVRSGEIVLERGATSRQLLAWMEMAGAFIGPAGEYYAPRWFKLVKQRRQDVENVFLSATRKVVEEGARSIGNLGGWMNSEMNRIGKGRERQ